MRHSTLLVVALLCACNEPSDPAPRGALAPEAVQSPRAEPAAAPEAPAPEGREHENPDGDHLGVAADGLGLVVGDPAPAGAARDLEGAEVTLASLIEGGPIMVVFYRGGWCPYCTFQVRTLTEAFADLRRRGVTPVLISVDRAEEARRTQATYEIPFPVLSDPDLTLHRAFHVVHEADAAEVERLRGFGHDVEAFSGRDHHSFAVPSVFIIDGDGNVRWQHVDPEYRVRPSVAQLLNVLDELALAPEG